LETDRGEIGGARRLAHEPARPASPTASHQDIPGRSPGSRVNEKIPEAAPSQVEKTQWRVAVSLLAYRCGGSAGIAIPEAGSRTGFPFNPSGETPSGHPKLAAL